MHRRPTMLSATFVKNVSVPGRYGDGRGGLGLTLLVKPPPAGAAASPGGRAYASTAERPPSASAPIR